VVITAEMKDGDAEIREEIKRLSDAEKCDCSTASKRCYWCQLELDEYMSEHETVE